MILRRKSQACCAGLVIVAITVVSDTCVLAQSARPTQHASDRSGDAARLQQDALAAMELGDDDRAFKLARTAVSVAPENPQSVFLLAMILGQRHRFPEAIKMLDDLAEENPAVRLPVLGQTAEWMVSFGMWSDAEQRYRTILASVPDSVLVHRNLAQLLVRQGRRFDALAHLHSLCRQGNVKEAELRTLLMLAFPFAGDASSGEASLGEYDPIGVLGTARGEIGQGNWDAAKKLLEQASPGDPAAVALLGRCYAHLQDDKALDRWAAQTQKRDQEAVPGTKTADEWFARGVHAANHDDHRAAVRCFGDAVLLDQTDAEAYQRLSRSLEALGFKAEAQQASKRAEMIETTQSIGKEMAANKYRDREKITTLINLLGELHRPIEALSWRGVRLAYGRSESILSDAEATQVLSEIMRDRGEQLESNQTGATEEFLLCGVDLESFASLGKESAEADPEDQKE